MVGLALFAEKAGLAEDERFDGDPVPGLHVADFGPDLPHCAGKFVPRNERIFSAFELSLEKVDVGPANATGLHVHHNFGLPRNRVREIAKGKRSGFFNHDRFHCQLLLLKNETSISITKADLCEPIIDDLVKSLKVRFPVIPAKAGIQFF
jgi:hypothetical protein